MKLTEKIRYILFWLIAYLLKRPLFRHYRDVASILDGNNTVKTKTGKDEVLLKILNHAVSTTTFYSKCRNFKDLSNFPVVNKTIIKNAFVDFMSDTFKGRSLNSVVTSGSTGTPFKVFQNSDKKLRNYADVIYFSGKSGFKIGYRLVYLKIWVEEKMRSKNWYLFQNTIPVDVVKLDNLQIEALINDMERTKSTYGILGYASALELICRYLDQKHPYPVKAKVRSIIAMSESLNDFTRAKLKEYFGATAVSRYSNLENGIIAQQEVTGSENFLVNTASYNLEILKIESDEPEEDGILGRIVVTDLFNYAMPLIRYDTGDIGSIITDPESGSKKYLSKVEGRRLDLLYNTKGELISSFTVYKNMWQYTDIDQYQLVQNGEKEYIFRINTIGPFNKEKQLIREFKSYLGEDADFKLEYVSEIPLLSSGKRKKIVNNYIKS